MKFQFVKGVDTQLMTASADVWRAQIAANPASTSEAYYESNLAFFANTAQGQVLTADAGGCLCGVIEEGNEHCSAFIVVSHAKVKKDLRIINMVVEPSLNLADEKPDYRKLALIAATAIVECLNLTFFDYPSDSLKLFATFPLDKSFMEGVATLALSADFTVTSQGNWLSVSKVDPTNKRRLSLVELAS